MGMERGRQDGDKLRGKCVEVQAIAGERERVKDERVGVTRLLGPEEPFEPELWVCGLELRSFLRFSATDPPVRDLLTKFALPRCCNDGVSSVMDESLSEDESNAELWKKFREYFHEPSGDWRTWRTRLDSWCSNQGWAGPHLL
jgi:hypothetical protein